MNGVITSLQSSAAERIGWMRLHSLWQLALLAGAYLVVRQLLQRRSAALRYLAACAIMSCMVLVLPLTALRVDVQPPTVLTQLRSDKAMLSTNPPVAERTSSELAVEAKSPIYTAITVNAQWVSTQADPIAAPAVARWKERIRDLFAPVLPWIVAAWLIGVVVLAVRQLGGWMVMRRLCGAGTEPVNGAVVKKLQQIAKRLGVQRAVRLLASANVDVPSVVGHFKPVILLPASLISGFTPDEIEVILGHESAHIRRHDYLINLIQTTFETLLFYHPAVWWISREIRRERENCCDDLAVYACGDRVAYARTLAKLEENRASIPATAMAASGGSLLDRIRRLVGQPATHHASRGTWLAGAIVILTLSVIIPIALAVGSGAPIDFDFNNPPMGYEHGIRAAGTDHQIKAGRLQFKLSHVTRGPNGTLKASLGLEDGYEVVMFRLFDHATRKLVHDSEWQLNLTNDPSTRKFQATRVGETNQGRIAETGGTLPKSLDLWLRIVENGRGDRIRIPAKQDASTKHGNSEIVVTSLLAGSMSGRGSPSGKMIWDTSTAHNTSWQTTVDLENRGELLRGRYHLVAVTKKGWRHAMNHKHFLDFSQHGRHNYTQLDVPPDQIDHFELIPFKKRHKFFFNGVVVPRTAKADRKTAPSADRSPQAAAGRRLTEAAGRRRFLAIERIARWPMAKQAKGLPHFYRNLDPRSINPMVEGIRLAREKEARFRIWAAMLASKLPPQSFKAVRNNLLALLNDKDESVRFDALRCFGAQKDLAAGSVILELLRREQIDEGRQVTVMQSMSALSGKTWNYNMHNWGPDKPGNGSAIQQFETWLEKQRRKAGVTTGPVDIEIVAATTKFEVAEPVLINDGHYGYVSEKENVIHGRADVAFQLAAKGSINWGKPVDGVQARLTGAERVLGRSDWPHPVLRLRYNAKNEGQYTLHLPKNGLSHQVEVDGQWYEWVDPRLVKEHAEPVVSARGGVLLDFESGRLREGQEVEIAGNWRAIPKEKESAYAARQHGSGYAVLEADDGKELVLTEGRHQVRIAVVCPSARAPCHGVVRAVSQVLWVEIDALSARVVEMPTLQWVKYVGNEKIKDKVLAKETGLKVGDPLDPYAVKEGQRKIEDSYGGKGFNEVQVTILDGYKVGDQGATYVIDEGQSRRTGNVRIIGNTFASDARLKTQIQSKPEFLRLFRGDVDRAKIDQDVERLVAFYRSHGFFHARIGRTLESNEKGNRLTLTFIIHEGDRYAVRNVSFLGNKRFLSSQLAKGLKLRGGRHVSQTGMNQDLATIRDLYGSEGYVFADIELHVRYVLEESGKIDLVYHITEGQRYRVGEIKVNIRSDRPAQPRPE